MPHDRRARAHGEDMAGDTVARRNAERMEIQKRVMEAGKDPNFRNRPEIAAMRRRAEQRKGEMARPETLEQAAARLRKARR